MGTDTSQLPSSQLTPSAVLFSGWMMVPAAGIAGDGTVNGEEVREITNAVYTLIGTSQQNLTDHLALSFISEDYQELKIWSDDGAGSGCRG